MADLKNEKHASEVTFLEAAAGLNLIILCAQATFKKQNDSEFPGLPMAQPAEPEEPVTPAKPQKRNVPTVGGGDGVFSDQLILDSCTWNASEKRYFGSDLTYNRNRVEDRIILDYQTGGFFAFSRVHKHNETVRALHNQAESRAQEEYESQKRAYSKQLKQYQSKLKEFHRAMDAYNQQFQKQKNIFLDIRKQNIDMLKAVLGEAMLKLERLYATARMLPKPYQYPEAVFYLYDFLSTSSDEYDIKYALERVDANEMKRMMAEIIQNKNKQDFLLGTLLLSIASELERIGKAAVPGSDAEKSLQDSRCFIRDNADFVKQLKPLPL
jgi:hypothetical protein